METNIKKHAASLFFIVFFSLLAFGSTEEDDIPIPITEGTVVDKGYEGDKTQTNQGYTDPSTGQTYGGGTFTTHFGSGFWIEIRNSKGQKRRVEHLWLWTYFRIKKGDYWKEE